MHGTADEKLGIQLARRARAQLERLSLALTCRALPMSHTITSETLAEVTSWLSAQRDAAHDDARAASVRGSEMNENHG